MLVLLVVDSGGGIYMMTCLFRCQLTGDELCFPYGGCQKPRPLKPSLPRFPSSQEIIEEGFFATDSCRSFLWGSSNIVKKMQPKHMLSMYVDETFQHRGHRITPLSKS